MQHPKNFDVIVVGGGHAGTEAALAAARMGCQTLLLTQSVETLGQMSCNPAIGGIGKGHLVREIDALGGIMGKAADCCGIQFRRLNARKGPAVRATRAQIDRTMYRSAIRQALESSPNLSIFQQSVNDLVLKGDRVAGVVTQMGLQFHAATVVMTVGTFLDGRIHVGEANYAGGRAGDPPSTALAQRLRELPFRVGRLKTGTPPRIDGATIDYSQLQVQPGDSPPPWFSFTRTGVSRAAQIPCHITATNERTHAIIRNALHRSPMYNGSIESTGPRYCPSIEDKVVRFADKSAHQIFVEPEGLSTREVYPNGISTSLPFDVQYELVRSMLGFENAHITRPGYAIEYDYFDPRDLRSTLETKHVQNLFFAGQINGTTGYEEAAAQGLVAGANAACKVLGLERWTLGRDEAYIGVLIDDLVTRGTTEPYRMFTSRAEYRLLLREDNADLRLRPRAYALGLIDENCWRAFVDKRDAIEQEQQRLETTWIQPDSAPPGEIARVLGQALRHEHSLADLLRRPEVSYHALMSLAVAGPAIHDPDIVEQIEIQARYAGYIERQRDEISRTRKQENTPLSVDLDYSQVKGLSNEVVQKLTAYRPETIGQASRISGITPVAISLLLVFLKHRQTTLRKSA